MDTLESKIDKDTTTIKNLLNDGYFVLRRPGRLKIISPHDRKVALAQKFEHNILSMTDHEWKLSDEGQTRYCLKCFRTECCPPTWTPYPNTTLTTEDIMWLISRDIKM